MNILEKIKPNKEEQKKLDKLVKKIIDKLNSKLVAAKAVPGGSYAKDTWLKEDHDIDIFILFNKKYDDKKISEVLGKILKRVFFWGIKRIQGSRTYYQIKKGKYVFEMVPVIEIQNPEEALNIMDISPLHVKWVNENARKMKDEIRKVKSFCKACHCYGAESYIKGFSGYVLEILTVYYGSFEKLIENAAKWEKNDVIDVKKRKIRITNKSKLSPLVVIDPIQKERNAAAALSLSKFKRFKKHAKEYMERPGNDFFVREENIPEDALVLRVKPFRGREDIIGSKLLKAYNYIREKLNEDFGVKDSFWYWHKDEWGRKAVFWYVLEKKELKPFKKHYGPSVDDEVHAERFRERWNGFEVYEEEKHLYVNIERENIKLRPYLKNLFKDDYLIDNVKGVRIKRE